MELVNIKCSIEGCNGILYCKKVCKKCYHSNYSKQFKELTDIKEKQCCVENCKKRKYAKNYCQTHYLNLKHGSNEFISLNKCKLPNCGKIHYGKGFCRKHYGHNIKANQVIKTRYSQNKYKCRKQNLEWSITLKEYSSLMDKKCFYCYGEINKTGKGLDRIDNKKGYTLDNVVPCCSDCNYLKGIRLSKDEMLKVIILLKELRKKENIWD